MNDLEKFYADSFRGLKTGAVTKGTVIQVKQDGIIVDVGSKSEGFIPVRKLMDNEHDKLKPGDEVDVFIERLTDSDGFVGLSRQKAEGINPSPRCDSLRQSKNTLLCSSYGSDKGIILLYQKGRPCSSDKCHLFY